MRIPRIYTQADLHIGSSIALEPAPAHHLSNVLRLTSGAAVIVFNGLGGQFEASITAIDKKNVQLHIQRFVDIDNESPLFIHLGIALSRGERMDHIMQKATELGVSEITPLFSERSQVKLKKERLTKKLQHWQNIIIGACEQSGRNRLPILNTCQPLIDWTGNVRADQKLVLHHRADQCLDALPATDHVALLIGPEGGLNDGEIKQAQTQQFTALSLGPRVLRTETAPLAAIALLQYRWGDM